MEEQTGLKQLIVAFLILRTLLKNINSASSMNQQVFALQTDCVPCRHKKRSHPCHSPNLRELRCDNLNYAIR
jgi:hypothetical protein